MLLGIALAGTVGLWIVLGKNVMTLAGVNWILEDTKSVFAGIYTSIGDIESCSLMLIRETLMKTGISVSGVCRSGGAGGGGGGGAGDTRRVCGSTT